MAVTITLEPPVRSDNRARNGRRIGWSEWGPEYGTPIVFCTGAGMTSSLGFGTDVLADLGIRLLCIDRAGLGRSAPDPHKSLASYADDVGAVLDELELDHVGVVGFSQGAPFAVALGRRARRLALVSAQDELAHPALLPLLHPEIARLVAAVSDDPVAFARSMETQVDAAGLWQLVIGMSGAHDQAVYGEPGFAAAYRQTLADGFAQGAPGYVRDLVLALGRWPVQPEDVRVPVDLWFGELDDSPVHSPDRGATLARRFPTAHLHVLPGEGSSLLWTQSRQILATLTA